MKYRRADIQGGTYFFTINLADRRKTLLLDEIGTFCNAINKVKKRHPFRLDAMVILPEHLHAIFTLPPGDNDYATRWMLIKPDFHDTVPKQKPSITATDKRRARYLAAALLGTFDP